MTDPGARTDLLPHNGTRREIAIQDADAAITDLDFDLVRRVGGPDIAAVPEAYLPHRAWGRSVDVWRVRWSVDTKRAAIVAAPTVHRYKGTPYAVETALAALQVEADIVEWWQETPRGQPYTFSVRARARAQIYEGGGAILSEALIRDVFSTVKRTKPLSRAFDLTIGATFPESLAVACAVQVASVRKVTAIPHVIFAQQQALGLAAVALCTARVRATALIGPA